MRKIRCRYLASVMMLLLASTNFASSSPTIAPEDVVTPRPTLPSISPPKLSSSSSSSSSSSTSSKAESSVMSSSSSSSSMELSSPEASLHDLELVLSGSPSSSSTTEPSSSSSSGSPSSSSEELPLTPSSTSVVTTMQIPSSSTSEHSTIETPSSSTSPPTTSPPSTAASTHSAVTQPHSTTAEAQPVQPSTSQPKPTSTSPSISPSTSPPLSRDQSSSPSALPTSSSTPSTTSTSETSVSIPQISPAKEFQNLAEEFFEWKLKTWPQYASAVGRNDDTAAHLNKVTPEHFEHRKNEIIDFLERAVKMNTETFSEQDLLNHKLFISDMNTYLQTDKYLKYLVPVSVMTGPQLTLQYMVKATAVLKSFNDFEKLLSRYSEFPRQAQEIVNIMKGNIADGLMPSNWSMEPVIGQFDALLVPYNESFLFEPFIDININITNEEKKSLQERAEKKVTNLLSALKMMRDFIETDYIPLTRSVEGVFSLPGGLDYYKACLHYHTTTDLTPQQIHDLGLSEVDRILKEVAQTGIKLGLRNKTIAEIIDFAKTHPSQQFASKEDLLNTYRDVVYNVLYPVMDRVVNVVPDVNLTVEENIAGSGFASYSYPSSDGTRLARFNINAKQFQDFKKYEVTALSLHEAIPGHHLHAVELIMNPSIPDFRKHADYYGYGTIPARFPEHTVFVEGWGLYSEYLGEELGLYNDPFQKLGRHSYELLRAARLVVDTGIHALGWTRQEAIDYLLGNTAMSEDNIKREVNRYITWPGQAVSYKIGEIKIKELRRKSEQVLGHLFRPQDFHDVVLRCSGPLNILEECVDSYINKTKDRNPMKRSKA